MTRFIDVELDMDHSDDSDNSSYEHCINFD